MTSDLVGDVQADALARLWHLRECELAARADLGQAYADHLRSSPFRTCDGDERLASAEEQDRHYAELEQAIRERRSRYSPPDHHVITGSSRRTLQTWLSQVVGTHHWLTRSQRQAMGDLTGESTTDDAVDFLASQGFEPACTTTNAGDLLIVMVHPGGLLAEVFAPAWRANHEPQLSRVRVYFNAAAIDDVMFSTGLPGTQTHYDLFDDGTHRDYRPTNIRFGEIAWYTNGYDGSLIVQLTAFHAFARPIAPWRKPAITWLGPDAPKGLSQLYTDDDESRHRFAESVRISEANTKALLANLPTPMKQLLGPELMSSDMWAA